MFHLGLRDPENLPSFCFPIKYCHLFFSERLFDRLGINSLCQKPLAPNTNHRSIGQWLPIGCIPSHCTKLLLSVCHQETEVKPNTVIPSMPASQPPTSYILFRYFTLPKPVFSHSTSQTRCTSKLLKLKSLVKDEQEMLESNNFCCNTWYCQVES